MMETAQIITTARVEMVMASMELVTVSPTASLILDVVRRCRLTGEPQQLSHLTLAVIRLVLRLQFKMDLSKFLRLMKKQKHVTPTVYPLGRFS